MTVFELYKLCKEELQKSNTENSENEARMIVEKALQFDRTQFLLKKNEPVDEISATSAREMFSKRLSGLPVQYILGEWDFFGRSFKVGEGVLIPRPETEELCSLVIERLKQRPKTVVFDLCSGSGCIGITIKKETANTSLYLIELYDNAIKYLNENRILHGLARSVPLVKGDVLAGYEAFGFLPRADVIVSNPPYIKKDELSSLQREVQNEPQSALDGGEDGLVFYRALCEKWFPHINDGGFLAVECGDGQARDVASLFSKIGAVVSVHKDFNGIERFVIAEKG